ncbi:hypothetical protein Ancab_027414 [Ancistrocladus abbreviatus]
MQMNTIHINQVKIEKRNAILRYNQLRKITNFFRVIGFFLFLVLVSQFSFQLPPVFKLSGEYFHNLFVILVSPSFVFIIGNAIVVILFAKSGQFSTQDPFAAYGKPDIYEQEYKKMQGKQRMAEENKAMASVFPSSEIKIHRSMSEKLSHHPCEKNFSELQRSSTEKLGKCLNCCKETGEAHYPADHMTSEEFRQTIEAFIARQQRFLREEEFSVVG